MNIIQDWEDPCTLWYVNTVPTLDKCGSRYIGDVALCDWAFLRQATVVHAGFTLAALAVFFCFVPFYTPDKFAMMVEEDLVRYTHGQRIYE